MAKGIKFVFVKEYIVLTVHEEKLFPSGSEPNFECGLHTASRQTNL